MRLSLKVFGTVADCGCPPARSVSAGDPPASPSYAVVPLRRVEGAACAPIVAQRVVLAGPPNAATRSCGRRRLAWDVHGGAVFRGRRGPLHPPMSRRYARRGTWSSRGVQQDAAGAVS